MVVYYKSYSLHYDLQLAYRCAISATDYQEYVPFLEVTTPFFVILPRIINELLTKVTRWVPLLKQELYTPLEHP